MRALQGWVRVQKAYWYALGRISPSLEPKPGSRFDWAVVQDDYQRYHDGRLCLDDPQTYVEKMAWEKLNHRNPLMNVCSDKLRVRDYLNYQSLGHLAVPVVQVCSSPYQIRWEDLPEHFVAKPNHGSQMVLICLDRSTFDFAKAKARLGRWMKRNYSLKHAETNYRGIARSIVLEPLIEGEEPLMEHKITCFNGVPTYVSTVVARSAEPVARCLTDTDWKPIYRCARGATVVDTVFPKPAEYPTMLQVASKLSKPFIHARVDFLRLGDRLYVGEITFFSRGGCRSFEPESADRDVAACVDLGLDQQKAEMGRVIVAELART